MIPDPHAPAILAIVVLATVLIGGVLVLRTVRPMRQRIDRLEDALRTYNNANVAVGRHVILLESELRGLQRSRSEIETPIEVPVLLRSRLGSQRIN